MDVRRWAGLTGIASVVLFSVANALWAFEQPAPGSSSTTIVDFYADASARIAIGAPLSLLSLALFALFACALRRVLLDYGAEELLADAALAGALLGLAPGLGAEAINMVAAWRAGDGELSGPLALALFDVSYVLGSYAAGPGFGVFTLAVSAAALRAPALLPRWLAIAGLAIGALLVTSLASWGIGEYTVAPAFVLVVILGVRLLRSGDRSRGARGLDVP